MTTLRTAAQQALEVLEDWESPVALPAIVDLRAALAEEALQRLTDVNQELEAALAEPVPPIGKASTDVGVPVYVVKKAEPVQAPQCNPHPKAPHGFLRNASHNEDRYVCECEGWDPYEAGRQAGMEAALAEPQEPSSIRELLTQAAAMAVAAERAGRYEGASWVADAVLETAPPQRKPLTEDQLDDIAVVARRGNLYDLRMAIERAHEIGGKE